MIIHVEKTCELFWQKLFGNFLRSGERNHQQTAIRLSGMSCYLVKDRVWGCQRWSASLLFASNDTAICRILQPNLPHFGHQFATYCIARHGSFLCVIELTYSLSIVCTKRKILRYFRPRGIPLPNTRVLEGVFLELSLQFAQNRRWLFFSRFPWFPCDKIIIGILYLFHLNAKTRRRRVL